MSLETALFPVLLTVCPRVYPDFAPTDTDRPYVTYQQTGGEVINPLSNTPPGRRNASVQVNVWAATRKQSSALMQQVEDAIRAATTINGVPLSAAFNDYDHGLQVYGSQQDFSVWY